MSAISFILPIEPVAWQRVQRDRYGTVYVPHKTRVFKQLAAMSAKRFAPRKPYEGAISIELTFVLKRPKRPKNKCPWPIVRPDTDNYVKGVLDAFNGLFWMDDSQVVDIHARKIYAESGTPEIRVRIAELNTNKPGGED